MIDLELIVLLDTVHRRGTLTSAAEELGKVPSALSYTIQKYEDALGFSLFQRDGRRVRFTEAGRHIYNRGVPLLQSAVQLREEAVTIARGFEPRLRVAVDAWVALTAVTPALNTLLSDFPDLELQVSEEALSGTWEALLDSRVDVAIGAPGPKPSVAGVQTEAVCELPGVFAVAAHHPLAASDSVADQAQLSGERWVILRDTARSWVPREVLAFNPPKKLMVGSMGDKIAAQVAGLGVGFLPEHLIRRELADGRLVAPRVSLERVQPKLLLAWRSDSRGRGLQQLLKLLRSHFA